MKYSLNLLKNIDKPLLVFPILFAIISLTILSSITYDGVNLLSRSVIIQGAAFVIGFIAIIVILFIDYSIFARHEKLLYIFSLLFLLTVYTPLGTEHYGSRAWIELGSMSMQPSELVKISFILAFATFLNRNRDKIVSLKGVLLSILYVAPILGIIIKEDLGSGLVLCFVCVGMIFHAGISGKLFVRFGLGFFASIPIVYRFLGGYQKSRIDAFLYPDNLSVPAAAHVYQSKVAIGSGGFWGKGLFSGTQKSLNYLPVKESDFIFAVIVEELGFFGGMVLISLYTVFLTRIWRISTKAKDLYGSLIVIGLLSMFIFQIFENVGMTMGLMPVTGITLPFISLGGSAILSNMVALGLILNIGIRNKTINF